MWLGQKQEGWHPLGKAAVMQENSWQQNIQILDWLALKDARNYIRGTWGNRERLSFPVGFPGGADGKESACNTGDPGSIPGSGKSPGEKKRMATNSGILAWGILWTEEPEELQFMVLQRVKDDWSTNTLTFPVITGTESSNSHLTRGIRKRGWLTNRGQRSEGPAQKGLVKLGRLGGDCWRL